MRRFRETSAEFLLTFRDATGPDPRIKEVLPRHLRDLVYMNRKSTRIEKIRNYFSKFTDRWYHGPGEEVSEELLQVNRYLQLHLVLYSTAELQDDTPIVFFHANVPEIMLEIIRHSFDPENLLGHPKVRRLPFLAVQVLCYFLHRKSQTFMLAPDRIFHDSLPLIDGLVKILNGRLAWFDSLTVVHIFAVFAHCPAGVHWYQSHPDIIEEICRFTYRACEIVEEKISEDKVSWRDESLASILTVFKDSDDLVSSARVLGLLATNHAVVVLSNTLKKSLPDYEKLMVVSGAVKKTEIFTHFSSIFKRIMIWIIPGRYLSDFLSAIHTMLVVHQVVEELFLDNLEHCTEKNIPVGIESFKYWKHTNRQPSPLAFYFVHAFAMSSFTSSSDWCTYTLCTLLRGGEKRVTEAIVENYGHELMDLAHLVEIKTPKEMSVQSVILEALLRHGGFTHKVYNRPDTLEGTVMPPDDLPDFCLEAALFSKKAQCEVKMSLEEKQKRVSMADIEKDQGNTAFKDGNYNDAIIKYTNAIAICPLSARTKQSIYYSNRAECYLRVNDAKRAIHDCNRALCLDQSSRVKVQWRRSRAYQKLNLDYPAWLDMKCLEKEWKYSQANSGINFHQLLSSLTDQVGVYKITVFSEMEHKMSAVYH